MKLKANLFASNAVDMSAALEALSIQIRSGNNQGWIESYPSYGGSWSIELDQPRYSDQELDDLSTIPFGK